MAEPQELKPAGPILDVTVFVCGALVMVFEIVGSRILAPFIGTSTYIWTSLIGVILAALSLGYWLGGAAADRSPKIRTLSFAVMAASGLVSLTLVSKEVVLSIIASADAWLEFKSLLAALILFAPASTALGFVTPFAVKLRMRSLDDAGKTIGRLYALSTVGSIVGTFAAGFILIPFVGSIVTLYLIAGSLLLLGAAIFPFSLSKQNIAVVLLLILGIVTSELWRFEAYRASEQLDIDTQYSRVQVFKADDPKTGRTIRALAFDPYSTQSAMFLDGDDLVFEYTKFYHLASVLKPGFTRSLMIGGAGFSFPKAYLSTYPEAKLDVVEIDPGMTAVARKYFRLSENEWMHILHEDGRMFLNNAKPAEYDVVFMDAFGSMLSIPFHLTTIEAVRNVGRTLKDDGIVITNLGSAISGPRSRFLQAEFRTYQNIFPNVYLFKVHPERRNDELQNLIIAACKRECLPADPVSDAQIGSLLSRRYLNPINLDEPPLTDDLAPVERYISIAQASPR